VCCLLGMPCHQFRLEFVYPLGLLTVIPAEWLENGEEIGENARKMLRGEVAICRNFGTSSLRQRECKMCLSIAN